MDVKRISVGQGLAPAVRIMIELMAYKTAFISSFAISP